MCVKSQIVSLWDIMKPFQPSLLIAITDMYSNLAANQNLGKIIIGKEPPDEPIDEHLRIELLQITKNWERVCTDLELAASLVSVQRLRRHLENQGATYSPMIRFGEELKGRLRDEMMERFYWSLSLSENDHYANWGKGWEQIIERFKDTLRDIEEMRKCFALSRYAASVFHSVQIVEFGLIELGTFIRVKDPHSGWTAVTARLKDIAETPYAKRGAFEKANHQLLEQILATVESLKNAWRNKISHAQGRLTVLSSDFQPEIAEEIMLATRAFMRRLSGSIPSRRI